MNEINYTNEKQDFIDFSRFSLKIPKCALVLVRRAFIGAIIATLLSSFVFIKHLNYHSIIFLLIYFLSVCIIFTALVFISGFFINGHTLYNQMKGIDLNYSLALTEEGIKRTSSLGVSTINWSNVKEICNTKKAFYVFVSDFQAIMIPKRAFENAEQAQNFYNLMIEYKEKAHASNAC